MGLWLFFSFPSYIFSPTTAHPHPTFSTFVEGTAELLSRGRRELKNLRRRPAEISRVTETTTLFAGWIKNEDETEGPAGSPRLASEEKRGHQSAHHLNVPTTEWFKTPIPPRERFAELHRLRLIEFFQSLFLERPSLNCLPAWRTLNGGILKGSWKN